MPNFRDKRVDYEIQLKVNLKRDEEIRYDKNHLTKDLLSSETKVIVIGTMITNIPFFYTGPNNMQYKYIDDALENTRFSNLKFDYWKKQIKTNEDEAIRELKKALQEVGIVFLDLISCCSIKRGKNGDDQISNYVLASDLFENELKHFLKKNKNVKIAAASKNAKDILDYDFHITSNYYRLLDYNPNIQKAEWERMIVENLL